MPDQMDDKTKINENQERKEQPSVGGAGNESDLESETGRKGASENIVGTEQPGEMKQSEDDAGLDKGLTGGVKEPDR